MSRVKNAKPISDIPWADMLYYDETSPSCLRHKSDKIRSNNLSVARHAGEVAGNVNKENGYWVYCSSLYGNFQVHRIIWFLCHKEDVPANSIIDHVDGNKLNNKISNLRLVTEAENTRNVPMYKSNTTGTTGVYLDRKYKESYYWKASWMDLDGKQRTKSFSITKLGDELAFQLACEHRNSMIDELNSLGAGYSDRHGK